MADEPNDGLGLNKMERLARLAEAEAERAADESLLPLNPPFPFKVQYFPREAFGAVRSDV